MMKKPSLMIAAAVLAASVALGTACTKKPVAEPVESATEGTTAPETTKPKETEKPGETETTAKEAQKPEQKEMYHMLQGTVTKVTSDGGVFTLQADDGKNYDIKQSGILDVEVDIEKDVQIAIAYIGEPLGNLKDVTLVVALPEQEEWSILTEKGSTTANAMSSFTMETEDGRELSFMKDNCPIEDGALAADSGDHVEVTYVNSQGVNYPIEIKKGRRG